MISDFTFSPIWPLLTTSLGMLMVWGAAWLAWPQARDEAARMALLALVWAWIGMAATGFALAFGGIGLLIDHPDLARLVWEWTPLRQGDLAFWGVAGWMGFGLQGAQTPLAAWLLFTALPGSALVAVISMIPLRRQGHPWAAWIMAGLSTLFLAPLAINWTQAGGWLMHLGQSAAAGQGYLDALGGSFFLVAGGAGLALWLGQAAAPAEENPQMRTDQADAWAAGWVVIAGTAWAIMSPLVIWQPLDPMQAGLNLWLAAAAGGFIGMIYGWYVSGSPANGWLARALVAGWVAALAPALWLSPWQALGVGAIASWLFILVNEGLEAWLNRADKGSIVAMFTVPAIWGALAVGFFLPDPGQMRAQGIGIASLMLLGFLPASLVQGLARMVERLKMKD